MSFLGKIVRFYLIHINRTKLKKYLANRKGKCLRCGKCCKDSYCPAYNEKSKLCRLWKSTHDTILGCRDFPFMPYHVPKGCGYYWKYKEVLKG